MKDTMNEVSRPARLSHRAVVGVDTKVAGPPLLDQRIDHGQIGEAAEVAVSGP